MTEAQIQKDLIVWARDEAASGRIPELRILNASLNGAYLSGGARQWGQLAAQGALKGLPDLHLPVARNGFNSLYIELKTEHGRLHGQQSRIHALLRNEGNLVHVCYGFESAKKALLDYLEK